MKLYIEGKEDTIEEIIELVRKKLGNSINAVNCADCMVVLDGSERCSCGGEIKAYCLDCGEELTEVTNGEQ